MSPRKSENNEAIKRQMRKNITDAAFELFGAEGFTQTSISAIAKKAGISKGLIYHYFTSKEEILEAIFESLMDLSKQLLHFKEGMTAKEKMKVMIEGSFYFIVEMTNLARLTTALVLQPDAVESIKAVLDKRKEEQIRMITDIFKEMAYDDPETESFYFGAKMDGIMLGHIAMKDEYPLEKMKQKILYDYGFKNQ